MLSYIVQGTDYTDPDWTLKNMEIVDLKNIYSNKINNFFKYYINVKSYLSFQQNVILNDLVYTSEDIIKCLEYVLNKGYSFLPIFIYLYCITQEWQITVNLESTIDNYINTYKDIEDFETIYKQYINKFNIINLPILNFFIEQKQQELTQNETYLLIDELTFFWKANLISNIPSYVAKNGYFEYQKGLTDTENQLNANSMTFINNATYIDSDGKKQNRYITKNNGSIYDIQLQQYLVGGDN